MKELRLASNKPSSRIVYSYYYYYYLCVWMQKRVLDLFVIPCGCWESNLHPLDEQPVLLTSEPPL